jgi:hypothetical protein
MSKIEKVKILFKKTLLIDIVTIMMSFMKLREKVCYDKIWRFFDKI